MLNKMLNVAVSRTQRRYIHQKGRPYVNAFPSTKAVAQEDGQTTRIPNSKEQ